MVLSAMLPSCSSEIFTPTIILKTWKTRKSRFYLYFFYIIWCHQVAQQQTAIPSACTFPNYLFHVKCARFKKTIYWSKPAKKVHTRLIDTRVGPIYDAIIHNCQTSRCWAGIVIQPPILSPFEISDHTDSTEQQSHTFTRLDVCQWCSVSENHSYCPISHLSLLCVCGKWTFMYCNRLASATCPFSAAVLNSPALHIW